jgi:hypothetical protein
MHNIPFSISVTSTAFAKLLLFFHQDFHLIIHKFAGMLPLLVFLSLSTPSDTLHLNELADIAVAAQHYFYTRGTVLLMTQETCKYSTIDSASKSDVSEFITNT